MKKKIDLKLGIIGVLTIILIVMCFFYFREEEVGEYGNLEEIRTRSSTTESSQESEERTETISSTSEVSSGLIEEIQLHTTYYLEESYVEENQSMEAGENMLKYTNGRYLTAPYNCVITKINLPEEGEVCTTNHSIQIEATNILKVQLSVDETDINKVQLGQQAEISISAWEDKIVEGVVTNISNTASNGRFTVTVEFQNDGEIMLGMTAVVTLK